MQLRTPFCLFAIFVSLANTSCQTRKFQNEPADAATMGSEMGPQTVKTIYIHWTATPYSWVQKGHYHTIVTGNGVAHKLTPYNIMLNEHTYRRNTNSVGFATACMGGDDPWSTPCTSAQIETMCKEIAALAKSLGWKPADITIKKVMTHAEAASNLDNPNNPPHENYGPQSWGGSGERWDYLILKKGDKEGSGGDILRTKVKGYLTKMLEGNNSSSTAAPAAPAAAINPPTGPCPLPMTPQDLPPELNADGCPLVLEPQEVPPEMTLPVVATNAVSTAKTTQGTELFPIPPQAMAATVSTMIMKTLDFGPNSKDYCVIGQNRTIGINMRSKEATSAGWLAVNIDIPTSSCPGFIGPAWIYQEFYNFKPR